MLESVFLFCHHLDFTFTFSCHFHLDRIFKTSRKGETKKWNSPKAEEAADSGGRGRSNQAHQLEQRFKKQWKTQRNKGWKLISSVLRTIPRLPEATTTCLNKKMEEPDHGYDKHL
jgi:hypothetical protein